MKNIKTKQPTKKFDNKWAGPFAIIEEIGTHAYRLDLPGDLRRIHNVFHVSRLKSHHSDPFKRVQEPQPPVLIEGTPEYELEEILDSRPNKKRPQEIEYLVHWKGWNESFDQWVEWRSMEGAFDAVQTWHRIHPRKRAPLPRHMKRLEQEYRRIEELEKLEERKNELLEGVDGREEEYEA
jgi:hypothetical protein